MKAWSGRLRPWLDHPDRAGVFLDFDGTLAAIVDDPAEATALPGSVGLLESLVARYRVVGVVSGRPVAFLQEQFAPVDGLILVGLYGLEQADRHGVRELADAAPWRRAVEAVAQRAERAAPPGVRIERKGLMLTLHVRSAPGHGGWADAFAAEEAAATGLVVHPGKKSVELRPPVLSDKGSVLAALAAGLEAVCFFGDDRGDLPAFSRLRDLHAAGAATLAFAVTGPEAPPELLAQADIELDGPPEVLTVLRALAG